MIGQCPAQTHESIKVTYYTKILIYSEISCKIKILVEVPKEWWYELNQVARIS